MRSWSAASSRPRRCTMCATTGRYPSCRGTPTVSPSVRSALVRPMCVRNRHAYCPPPPPAPPVHSVSERAASRETGGVKLDVRIFPTADASKMLHAQPQGCRSGPGANSMTPPNGCVASAGGMVDRPLVLSMDELAKLPTITIACTLVRAQPNILRGRKTDPSTLEPRAGQQP